jgi:hypothetical protein
MHVTLHACGRVHFRTMSATNAQASTSSITGLLSHIYQVISNFRPVDTSGLSAAFKDQPNSFTYTVHATQLLHLHGHL